MTIADLPKKGKEMLTKIPTHVLFVASILLVGTLSFMLGMLAGAERERDQGKGFWIEERPFSGAPSGYKEAAAATKAVPAAPLPSGGEYVASKNGTRYYLPWCGGVSRIKEENKVWFASKEAAEAAGYTPAKNCKGL